MRLFNLICYGFLLGCCLFFSGYDLLVEQIWWTILAIYLPAGLLFGLGFRSWQRRSRSGLRRTAVLMLLISIFLLGYGGWLWSTGEVLWGPLTLGFLLLTGPLAGMAWRQTSNANR